MVHYLVALDSSEGSMKALQKALKIMHKDTDHITALHAVDFPVVCGKKIGGGGGWRGIAGPLKGKR